MVDACGTGGWDWKLGRNDILDGRGGDDYLYGNGGSDKLFGGSGNGYLYGDVEGEGQDVLHGQAGDDYLNGGALADLLIGGEGDDAFAFEYATESQAGQRDIITSGDGAIAFEGAGKPGGDVIDLASMDADLTNQEWDSFTFGGTGVGHISVVDQGANSLVRGNVDDDPGFELQILIADGAVRASAYIAEDFILIA